MEDKLIEILSQYDYPVILQGSLTQGEEYPEHFFTYWQTPGADSSLYENNAHSDQCDYDVYLYRTDAALVYKMPVTVKQELVKNGFIVPGTGYSVASDEPTHTGRGIHVFYKNRN